MNPNRNTTIAAFAALAFLLPAAPVAARQDAASQNVAPMPVRGASLVLKVTDFASARARLLDVASDSGASVIAGQTTVDAKGRKHGIISLRLPAGELPKLLPAIRAIGVLSGDNIAASDASGDYETLAARIVALRRHQTRLESLLHSGRNLRGSDVLYLQERLLRGEVDEAALLQSRREIEKRSSVAQVSVTLFEPLPVTKPPTPVQTVTRSWAHGYANAVRRAEFHRAETVNRLLAALAFVAVYAPLWVPATCLVLVVLWQTRRLLAPAASAVRTAIARRFGAANVAPVVPD